MRRNKVDFILLPTNYGLWNSDEFIELLVARQGTAITISTHSEGVCLESIGVYKLLDMFGYTDVTIRTTNFLETHPRFKIQIHTPCKFIDVKHAEYKDYHAWNENKVFGCLYNRPLWHRIALAAKMQSDYADITLLNMRANPNDCDQFRLFEIQELFEFVPEFLTMFAQQRTIWPKQLEDTDGYTVGNTTNGHTDQLAKFYPHFLIDIVAETWTHGRSFFPTEKTIRPMLLKKPFIVMGSRDYLAYLRQLGFWTFDHFWSEHYDGFDNRDRFLAIVELIDSLAKKSKVELYDMYSSMQYVLDHNYKLLQDQNFLRTVQFIND